MSGEHPVRLPEPAVRGVVPVLVYHSVSEHPPPGEERWTVTPLELAAHLEIASECGREAVTISELAAALRGERDFDASLMAFTFDDGRADNVAAAAALAERGWPSTLYVTTGEVGAPGHLTHGDLAALAADPLIELGAHTVRHPYLDELAFDEMRAEVAGSRTQLELLCGAPVRTFAYPYGAHDRAVRSAVVNAGYDSACAVKNAFSHPADDPFAIARWIVERDTPVSRVREVFAGRGLPRAWARERLRTNVYRRVRRARRRLATVTP